MDYYFLTAAFILFQGFFQLMCSKSCCVYFHKICWKKFKNLKYPGENDQVLYLFFLKNFTTAYPPLLFPLFSLFPLHFFLITSFLLFFSPFIFFFLFSLMLFSSLFVHITIY